MMPAVVDAVVERVTRVLVVDDEPAITVAFAKKLRREGYDCVTAGSAEEALRRMEAYKPALVISDVRMPGMSGLDLLKEIKRRDAGIKVILITAYTDVDFVVEALRHDADDYLLKPFNLRELASSVSRALGREPRGKAATDSALGILALAKAIESRDPFASGHIERVAGYARAVGVALGIEGSALHTLWLAAILHDVGKLCVPEAILNKAGSLTGEETAILRRYPEAGARIVSGAPELDSTYAAILQHRENWDGSGYPLGIRGDALSLEGRIINAAEALDAMLNDRPYRTALGEEEARRQLEAGAGSRYDPEVVAALIDVSWVGSRPANRSRRGAL